MGNYNAQYKEYYSRIKNKVSPEKELLHDSDKKDYSYITTDVVDVYPKHNQSNYSGSYRGSYYSSYYRGDMNSNYENTAQVSVNNKSYIHNFIIRLTCTSILFCGILILKMAPYEEAQTLYNNCKSIIKTDFDYQNFMVNIEAFAEDIKNDLEGKIEIFNDVNEKDKVNTFKEENKEKTIEGI